MSNERTEPTIGRVLLFWDGDECQEQPYAAKVARVNHDGTVNLGYLDSVGQSNRATHVLLIQGDDIKPNHGLPYCEWMQYQIKLHAKNTDEDKKEKTLHNSPNSPDKTNVSDLVIYGNCDQWQLVNKASSKNEGWMKATKAMEIDGVGCFVQVTTQQGDNVSEALSFAEGVKIELIDGDKTKGRRLVKI